MLRQQTSAARSTPCVRPHPTPCAAARPPRTPAESILALQRSAGNAAVAALLPSVQREIVGPSGSNIWAEEIAGAVGAERDEDVAAAVRALHELDAPIEVTSYAELVRRINEGDFAAYLGKLTGKVVKEKVVKEKLGGKDVVKEKAADPPKKPDGYPECLARGQRIWADVKLTQSSIVAARRQKTALPAAAMNTKVAFEADYVTTVKHKSGALYQVQSQPNAMKKGIDVPIYTNLFDVVAKKITADRNWARDPLTDEKLDLTAKPLNNSEILWNQYRCAAEQHYTVPPTGSALTKQFKVKSVVRKHIENPTTQKVVDEAYPKGKHWSRGQGATWEPPTDNFLAVLGTPNASPVGYMLAQHMPQMEGRARTIKKIEARQDKEGSFDLVIHLKRGSA